MKRRISCSALSVLLILFLNIGVLESKGIEKKLEGNKVVATNHSRQENTIREETRVSVSAYYNYRGKKFANGKSPQSIHDRKVIALSKDLARKSDFGDSFILIVNGEKYNVVFCDMMHPKWRNKIDLYMDKRSDCFKWGVRKGTLISLKK